MKINNVLLGADPEVFLKNTSGLPVSAIGLIPGTKDSPYPITNLGHAMQLDNVAAEFCIPPSNSPEKMWKDIQLCLSAIEDITPKNILVDITASKMFDQESLQHPIAKQFGCDPDYCAWTENQNPRPNNKSLLRSCGGHLHIGYDNPDFEISLALIRALDLFLGIPSIILDLDQERRQLYGKAGAFRFKEYGVEYRTLSNFWIKDLQLVQFVHEAAHKAVEFVNTGGNFSQELIEEIISSINSGDVSAAHSILAKQKIEYKLFKELVK